MSRGDGGFWGSVGTVLKGSAVAQAVPVLGSLLIARIYVPAEFGVFAAWLGLAQLAAVLATGRYEVALALEPDGVARKVAVVATLAAALASGVLLSLAAATAAALPQAAGVSAALLWMAVPSVLALAATQTWQNWAAADGRFVELSRIRIVQAVAVTGLQVLAGLVVPTAAGLAGAQLAGLLVALWYGHRLLPLARAGLPPRRELAVAVRAFWSARRRFPLVALPADGISTAVAQLPVLIVGSRFGAEVAGHLALAVRVLGAPVGLAGSAVLDVFRRRSAAAWRERGECRVEFVQTLKVLVLCALPFAVILAGTAEPLFALAFGERWSGAGAIALLLLPLFALRLVASPLSYVFYVAGQQHVDLAWQAMLLVATVATLSGRGSADGALRDYALVYAALYALYLLLAWRASGGARP